MKMQLRHPNQIPYGGMYRLNLPEQGLVGAGINWDMLLPNLIAWRKANGVPIGLGFQEEVENALCQAYPAECNNVDSDSIRPRALGMEDVVVGTRTMLSHWMNSRTLVDRTEAERRAAKCVTCPLNNYFHKSCTGICAALREVVSSIINAQGTSYDSRLHQCSICGCFQQASIWVPLEIQVKPLTDEQKNQFRAAAKSHGCWKNPDLVTA
jgi:hypothetical protein